MRHVAVLAAAWAVGCQGTSSQQTRSQEPAPSPSVTTGATPNGVPVAPAAGSSPDMAASATPATSTGVPAATRRRWQLTPEQLEECIQSCGRIQENHPEETPYDCRATCINGRISP